MRNLKRMLCLALTVVMLVGMMVIGAGATSIEDFGDKAEIQYTDAVALMTELGVFSGANDGNFYPQGTLTREQLAKIAYLLYNVNTDYTIYEGTATDLGDIAGRWSTGAIAWCNTYGILVGGTDGNFYPEDTLTVAQTQVTLLRVLGYDNTLSGLTGSKWDINAGILATERGLMKGLTSLKSGDPITREQACQMAFNAIFTQGVVVNTTYNFLTGEIVPTGYDTDEKGNYNGSTKAETVFGLTKISATVGGFEADNKEPSLTAEGTTSDGKPASVNVGSDPSLVGCSVTVYATGSSSSYTAVYVANDSSVVATIAGEDYSSLVGSSKTYIPNITAVYVNGELKTATDDEGATVPDLSGIGTGSIVELVNTNADGKIEVVRVTNKAVDTLASAPSVDSSNGTVTVTGATLKVTDYPAYVVGYEDLAAGDVVLYYGKGGVTYLEKAESVTGVVASVTGEGVFTVGGVKYPTSDLVDDSSNWTYNFKDAYTFYLDNYDNVVAIKSVDETETDDEYAVVLAFGYEGSAGTAIDAESSITYQVKLLFPDGTTDIGTVANASTLGLDASNGTLTSDLVYTIVSYTVSDGAYTLTKASSTTSVSKIVGGSANFNDTEEEAGIANNKTIFVIGTGAGITTDDTTPTLDLSDVTYTVYTGYSATPSLNSKNTSNTIYGVALTDGKIASLVFAWAKNLDGETNKSAAFIISDNYTQTSAGYIYDALVDGKLTTITCASDEPTGDEGAEATKITAGLYTVETTNGVTTLSAVDEESASSASAITVSSNGIVTANDTTYTYDDDTVVYLIKDGAATVIDVTTLKSYTDGYAFILQPVSPTSELLDYVYVYVPAAEPEEEGSEDQEPEVESGDNQDDNDPDSGSNNEETT